MKKIIKISICLIAILLAYSCKKEEKIVKEYSGSVMIYSTLDEKYLIELKNAFENEYKGVTLDYYFSTIDRVSHRLDVESSTYQLETDVIWAGTQIDAEKFKKKGLLEQYVSAESKKIPKNLKDKDGYYTAARITAIGIGYKNEEPKSFIDLLDEKYKNKITMTDPDKASIYKYFVACMMQNDKYGEAYFRKLKGNGLRFVDSATEAIKSVTEEDSAASFVLDYIAASYNNDERKIEFKYPNKDMIAMTTPVALAKDSYNPENGKLLIDFMLSYRGQQILSDAGLISVRKDVKNDFQSEKYISKVKAIDIDDMIENYDNYIEKFNSIMRG